MAFTTNFGKAFIPQGFRPRIRSYCEKAGLREIPYGVFGTLFFIGIGLTLLAYALFAYPFIQSMIEDYGTAGRAGALFLFTFVGFAVVALVISYLLMSCLYVWLDLRIFKRTTEMETVLVDFLQFVSENLKAGMSFDRALFFAIKPQFTILASEVRIAAKRAMTGQDVEDALAELSAKYDSNVLSRSFSIVVEGLRGGGEVAAVIDRVVDNLRETKKLKEEMQATTLGYVIFISFVVMGIAPGLFALAKQLLVILSKFVGNLAGSLNQAQGLSISFSTVAITPEQFTNFVYMALGVTGLFSAMILSLIQRGNVRSGLRYVPVFIIISYVVFWISDKLLTNVLGVFFK